MARNIWNGDAPEIAQVNTFEFAGTWEATDLVKVEFFMPDGTTVAATATFTAGSTTIANILSSLVTAWAALDSEAYPEFAEVTPTAGATTLTLTAATAGVPFSCKLTPLETGGGGADSQTIEGGTSATAGTAATANSGPNDWSVAANWSLGAVPANGDDVDRIFGSADILYGLAQSSVTLTSLNRYKSYTGKVGQKRKTSTEYVDYRTTELTIGATTVNIYGGARFRLNTGSAQTTVNVYETDATEDPNVKAVQWRGTHASNVLNVVSGSVAAAQFSDHTATIATARIGAGTAVGAGVQQGGTPADVFLRAGCTLTTVTKSGGKATVNSGATTVTNSGGDLTWMAGDITTLNCWGGTVAYNGVGTITTAKVGSLGTLDLSRDMRAMVITNAVQIYPGGTYLNPHRRGGLTVQALGCPLDKIKTDFGSNVQAVITAV